MFRFHSMNVGRAARQKELRMGARQKLRRWQRPAIGGESSGGHCAAFTRSWEAALVFLSRRVHALALLTSDLPRVAFLANLIESTAETHPHTSCRMVRTNLNLYAAIGGCPTTYGNASPLPSAGYKVASHCGVMVSQRQTST